MDLAKIRLSPAEMELIRNQDFILTKNAILEKVTTLLSLLSQEQQLMMKQWQGVIPFAVHSLSPKIAKGENYKGLPYRMLDYPRYFSRDAICAIRTFFWWGHSFNVTLHVRGERMKPVIDVIRKHWDRLSSQHFHLSISENEWEHHLHASHYAPMGTIGSEVDCYLDTHSFIKLAQEIPLGPWEEIAPAIQDQYAILLEILALSYQDGEKGLSPGDPIAGSGL